MKKPKSEKILGIEEQLKEDRLQSRQINKLTENSRQSTIQKHAQKMGVKLPKYNNLSSKERNVKQIEYLQRRLNQRINKQTKQLNNAKPKTLKINGIEFNRNDFSRGTLTKVKQIEKLSYGRIGSMISGKNISALNKTELYRIGKENGFSKGEINAMIKGHFTIKGNEGYNNQKRRNLVFETGDLSPLSFVTKDVDTKTLESIINITLNNYNLSSFDDRFDVKGYIDDNILDPHTQGGMSLFKMSIGDILEEFDVPKGLAPVYQNLFKEIDKNISELTGYQKMALLHDKYFLDRVEGAERYIASGMIENAIEQIEAIRDIIANARSWIINF